MVHSDYTYCVRLLRMYIVSGHEGRYTHVESDLGIRGPIYLRHLNKLFPKVGYSSKSSQNWQGMGFPNFAGSQWMRDHRQIADIIDKFMCSSLILVVYMP